MSSFIVFSFIFFVSSRSVAVNLHVGATACVALSVPTFKNWLFLLSSKDTFLVNTDGDGLDSRVLYFSQFCFYKPTVRLLSIFV